MALIPTWFPDVLRPGVPESLGPVEAALIAEPGLQPFWQALGEHAEMILRNGIPDTWPRIGTPERMKAPMVVPIMLVAAVRGAAVRGHDARGTAARRARALMDRRRKVARDARALIEELDQIQAESERSGDAAFRLIGTFDQGHLACREMAARLVKLIEVLERRPDWAAGPGFGSRKPSWRGFLREARTGLAALGFDLRERDAVALASAICRADGIAEPSRANVRDALRD